MSDAVYLYLDEGGELNFSPRGSRYFTLTGVTALRPCRIIGKLWSLRHELLEHGVDIEYFHASEDNQATRNAVFDAIGAHLEEIRIDSLIVEKCKTGPALRPPERFYPRMLGYLLKHVFDRNDMVKSASQVIVMTDAIPVQKRKKAMTKAVKQHLPAVLPKAIPYRLYHQQSKASLGLQIADYANWAILRKWKDTDLRSYKKIAGAVTSEFDIFRSGTRDYYAENR